MRSSSLNWKVALARCSGLSAARKRFAVSVMSETAWTWWCAPPTTVADKLRNERRLTSHIGSSVQRFSQQVSAPLHDLTDQIPDFGMRQGGTAERGPDTCVSENDGQIPTRYF